jgi:hypothetical protein
MLELVPGNGRHFQHSAAELSTQLLFSADFVPSAATMRAEDNRPSAGAMFCQAVVEKAVLIVIAVDTRAFEFGLVTDSSWKLSLAAATSYCFHERTRLSAPR